MVKWLGNLFKTRDFSLTQLKQLVFGPPTVSGVAVNEEIALGISAMWRAVSILASKTAKLEKSSEVVRLVPGKGRVAQPFHPVQQLCRNPNDNGNAYKHWSATVQSLVCAGNAFNEIERATDGTPLALHFVHWRDLEVLQYPDDPSSVFYRCRITGKSIDAADMLHWTLLSWNGIVGISPIRANRESLGISVAAERYAGAVYGNGATPRGFLKMTGGQNPNAEAKGGIREAWNLIYGGSQNSNKIGIMPPGVEWVETNMTPEDSQLLQSRAFQVQEVSRITGVPENLLFSGARSYNSDEEANAQFFSLGLQPILDSLSAEIEMKLLTPKERFLGYEIRYKVDEFRTNFLATSNAWTGLVLKGVATQNEAREAVGLNPKEGGDVLLVPTNMSVLVDENGNDVLKGDVVKQDAPDPKQREAVKDALLAQIGRGLRRQAKSPNNIRAYVVEAVGPQWLAYALAFQRDETVEEFADAWVAFTEGRDPATVKAEEILDSRGN